MRSLHGNTQGLKPNQLRRIEKLYQRRISPNQIVTPEFARQLSELSHETRRQIGALIDRKGYVEFVIVGDARRIELPDFKRIRVAMDRFRGLRCVHTHLRGEDLTRDDLTDLALLRLDLMAAIDVDAETGLPGLIRAAHLLPSTAAELNGGERHKPYAFLESRIVSQMDLDFLALNNSLEEEMARNRRTTRRAEVRDRTILVGVTTGSLADAEESMAELQELATSAGVVVLDKIIQRRPAIDPRTVLGRGKLDELLIRALQLGADLLVFDRELQPAQVRSLSEATDLKVIDRAQLILDIFAQRAQSREGKIQVELAQLKYLLPRLIVGQDSAFSRLAGGIGGRGPGETKLETDRRRVRDRIHHLEKQLQSVAQGRHLRRQQRQRRHLPVISIVGYTNAGKSTLLNTLTKSDVLVQDSLFATLDPSSRRLRFPRDLEVIITDTVGFIRDLPPDLMAAFRATLDELRDADLLLHVVDMGSPYMDDHIRAVETILSDLEMDDLPRLMVLNKMDRVAPEVVANLERLHQAVPIAACDRRTLPRLIERLQDVIWDQLHNDPRLVASGVS